jgi:hypothetical protein
MNTNPALPNLARLPSWLVGGTAAWLAYAIGLSALFLRQLSLLGVPYTIQIYSMSAAEPLTPSHVLLLGMVAPGFFIIQALSFFGIHIAWVDAAIYNWQTMVLLSSAPLFLFGALVTIRDRRTNLAGAIFGLLMLGGSLLFILNRLLAR